MRRDPRLIDTWLRTPSLRRQTVRAMLVLVLGLECAFATVALLFVLQPMAQRSAHDLAGLMVLSANTWAELPPGTRPAFERELQQHYRLSLQPGMAAPADQGLIHGFYIGYLESALRQRLGHAVYFDKRVDAQGHVWLWTSIPAGGRDIGVGVDNSRIQTQPLRALLLGLLLTLPIAIVLALWWARRITRPVEAMERAAAKLARGDVPQRLPEGGSRELARLTAHFNQMAQRIDDLLQARTVLLAGVSHDLRTPLARIRLALELQRMQPSDARLDQIERDVLAMDRLIGDVLQLARGLQMQAPQELELLPWLEQRRQEHADWAQAQGCTLDVQCPADLHAWVDVSALQRVVDNLLGNAVRHAPGSITLRAEPAPEQGWVRLSIDDRGPGIAADQLQAVFEPFVRLDKARTPGAGSGLGLAIVRQLAQQHGWPTGLQAREGGGLQAWVDVPEKPSA
ncbi:ATP-binding protein [Thiomonas bhubaneswarensis]|uniref:histidine kinase n=1 Tax=Thiomonas bhubaneswarensis TaxID=339866 RepID=A0A0K6I9S1_9BURK|nr:ATP-binding protein [Thiomonas bhubaneswarensis]CUA99890.1 Signal transduction histidine kinase [Thiomonas bhubaneswarensis]